MLLGAIFKRFDTIAEFTAFENFYSFDKKIKITLVNNDKYPENLIEINDEEV